MSQVQKFTLLLARLIMGWIVFYMGFVALRNPDWSLEALLSGTHYFATLYNALLSVALLPTLEVAFPWVLMILGGAVVLGALTRITALLSAIIMLILYVPSISVPVFGSGETYIVNAYLVYTIALLLLGVFHAGKFIGVDSHLSHD